MVLCSKTNIFVSVNVDTIKTFVFIENFPTELWDIGWQARSENNMKSRLFNVKCFAGTRFVY